MLGDEVWQKLSWYKSKPDEVVRDASGAVSPVGSTDTENMSSSNPLSSVTWVYLDSH